MKIRDQVTAQLKVLGFSAEKSATGGYWVETDWDYEGGSRWNLFFSADSALKWAHSMFSLSP